MRTLLRNVKGSSADIDGQIGNRIILRRTATLISVALLAAACGSSATSSAHASKSSRVTDATTTVVSSGNTESLKENLARLERVPSFTSPGPAFNVSKLAGSKIVSVDCDPSAPSVAQPTAATVSAGKVAGITVTVLAGGNENIALDTQFIDQAINFKPIAIILVGCTPPLLTVPLQAAKAAKIPVIAANYIGPIVGAPGQGAGPLIFGVATQPNSLEGTIMAEEIAASGPNDAQIGFISSDEIAESNEVESGFKAGLKKYCPRCKVVDTQNVNPSNWVTSLSSTINAMLVAHPKMNYLVPVFDSMAPFVTSAIGDSNNGKLVKVITTRGSTGAAMTDVENSIFMSDIGSSNIWQGWAAVDQAMRAAMNLPPESNPFLPMRLETAASLKGTDPNSDSAIYGDSYVQGFKFLWGLG